VSNDLLTTFQVAKITTFSSILGCHKKDDLNVFSIVTFIQIIISYKYKAVYATTNHFVIVYATTSHFYQVPRRTFASIVAKMFDLDTSHNAWVGMGMIPCSAYVQSSCVDEVLNGTWGYIKNSCESKKTCMGKGRESMLNLKQEGRLG
jgi:hypothetical protein